MTILFSPSVSRLIDELSRLPGIGPKTAQRLALHLLNSNKNDIKSLVQSIEQAVERVTTCSVCQNLTERVPCEICDDEGRDKTIICVVEEPKDVIAMEKSGEFHGTYHVLHGAISPIDGIGPEDLKIKELIVRLKGADVKEIIIATDPNIQGETTIMYLAKLLKPTGIKLTRLASGIPVGGDLDYADELTLARALEGRREI
jgi:recombination protein RecR